MKRWNKITIIFILVLSVFGCYLKEASTIYKGTPSQQTKLASGSRILLSETTPGFATYEIKKFRKDIKLPGFVMVDPPPSKYKGVLLPEIVKKMAEEMKVDLVFIGFVGSSQQMYIEVKGQEYKETKQEVKGVQKAFLLTNYSCDVYQYNGRGQLIGHTVYSKPFPKTITCPCPPVYYDGIEEFEKWLRANVLAQ